ncbi:MAG TPA: glutamine-hydrolyzing carbamoyl-phosphate synthase small subunit [Candidatus Thermoplasmatota archaeon]|jgi:carbamoyl-phosphate synthase small subunit|nr:glutamine-hydrolyzing carbamoyl-phosphate synthase small subunit [Candidatus Thermoplasmatota archaeon]
MANPRAARLLLEDGTVVRGGAFGAEATVFGELVFNTSMTGYQESLTDPSYAGQILLLTYPLIGNYAVNADDFESRRIWPRGFVVREACKEPSHRKSSKTIDAFLRDQGVPGIEGVDTRALTLATRARGTLKAALTTEDRDDAELLGEVQGMAHPDSENLVGKVSVPKVQEVEGQGARRIVLLDCGAKENIVRHLSKLGTVVRAPWNMSAAQVLGHDPDGVFISNGPGDPSHPDVMAHTVKTLQALVGQRPVMGICLGHQILGLSFGAKTFKLKFGHRGANQPVKDLASGRVFITSQNHGYAVDVESAKAHGLDIAQVNGNDGTSEGFRHKSLPVFSVQYHPEAHPGPRDTEHLFAEFERMMAAAPRRGGR